MATTAQAKPKTAVKTDFPKETYMRWYEMMYLMRKFEDKAGQLGVPGQASVGGGRKDRCGALIWELRLARRSLFGGTHEGQARAYQCRAAQERTHLQNPSICAVSHRFPCSRAAFLYRNRTAGLTTS